jgi:hypothetical protein
MVLSFGDDQEDGRIGQMEIAAVKRFRKSL